MPIPSMTRRAGAGAAAEDDDAAAASEEDDAAADAEEEEAADAEEEDAADASDAASDPAAPVAAQDDGPAPADAPDALDDGADADEIAAEPAATVSPAPAAATAPAPAAEDAPAWADPDGATPEEGLLILRDRSLWPPTWAEDGAEVRAAFRSATLGLVANRVGLELLEVEAHAYLPGGGPPPALVVVELSDRSGRDLGDVRGLGDPRQGLRPEGPPPTAAVASPWWPVGGIGERVPMDGVAPEPIGGADWSLTADGGFARITLSSGATWRAVAGVPLWSDGRYALVRDGTDVVLVDFLLR
jgi:hypothetical protein